MTNIRKMRRMGLSRFALFILMIALSTISLTSTTQADTIVLDDFSQSLNATGGVTATQINTSGIASNFNLNLANARVSIRPNTSATWRDSTPGSGTLWNSRYVQMSKPHVSQTSTLSSVISINSGASGKLVFTHPDADQTLSASISYRNLDGNGSLARDLSEMVSFVIDVDSFDQSISPSLTLYDVDGKSASKSFSTPLSTGLNTLAIGDLFKSVNKSSIVRVDLNFALTTGSDLAVREIFFAPVPEPSTVALAFLIAAFCGSRIARRNRSK